MSDPNPNPNAEPTDEQRQAQQEAIAKVLKDKLKSQSTQIDRWQGQHGIPNYWQR
jgi:hypothetical protein